LSLAEVLENEEGQGCIVECDQPRHAVECEVRQHPGFETDVLSRAFIARGFFATTVVVSSRVVRRILLWV
jgi:hypothetical protein